MSEFFLKIVNMSISASYIVLAVLLLRILLKRAPKWIHVLLWGIVAVRLACPFSFESALSLIPSAETVSPDIMMDWTPEINTGIPIVNGVINPVISDALAPNLGDSANPLQIWIPVLSVFWLVGMTALLAYAVISYIGAWRKVRTAILVSDRLYQSENVTSPFVLGLLRPRIYLPFNIDEKNMAHVVAHERAHIHRRDHLWKPLGFLLLTLHWFNPLVWLAYVLLCRDIELACDESVVKALDRDARADYSEALLICSVSKRRIAACPLAFGEVSVKARIRSVLTYKKPAFWMLIAAILACIVLAVCFLTDPAEKDSKLDLPFDSEAIEEIEMYHYVGTPGLVEKKVIVSSDDIKALYEMLERVSFQNKKTDATAGGETTSFRFHLSDGTSYELIYRSLGVKKGLLKSPTGHFEYFTSADIGWSWQFLNETLASVTVDKAELPGMRAETEDANAVVYVFLPPSDESGPLSYLLIRDYGCNVKDVHIEAPSVRFENGKIVFDVSWINDGASNVDIGPDFELYRYQGSALEAMEHKSVWLYYRESLAGKGMNVAGDAATLAHERTTSYHLSEHYGVLSPGDYRLEAHGAWVDFQIVDHSDALFTPKYDNAFSVIDDNGI